MLGLVFIACSNACSALTNTKANHKDHLNLQLLIVAYQYLRVDTFHSNLHAYQLFNFNERTSVFPRIWSGLNLTINRCVLWCDLSTVILKSIFFWVIAGLLQLEYKEKVLFNSYGDAELCYWIARSLHFVEVNRKY